MATLKDIVDRWVVAGKANYWAYAITEELSGPCETPPLMKICFLTTDYWLLIYQGGQLR
jgi:hypothetical protein